MTHQNEHGAELPYIPPVLIDALERKFPDRVPTLTDTDREIWYKAGQVHVIRYLRDQVTRQNSAGGEVGLQL